MRFEQSASRACLVLILLFVSFGANAQTELDAGQKERAENLFSQLRCVVCQNQSIQDSDADVAKDLRAVVNEQIAEGQTDSEIKSFLVDRYGEFVLLRPVFSTHTAILWGAPFLFVLLGVVMLWRLSRRKAAPSGAVTLNEDEERRLRLLLDDRETEQ